MILENFLNKPGEHSFFISGNVGQIEVSLTMPPTFNPNYVAFLGHPHSLQGGTMNNKVVTTMARVFKELGIASIRFNFRGVGKSDGEYDAGVGESEDMLSIVRLCEQEMPGINCIFAGFSFGSYVAYRAAANHSHALLITIAPPVHHYDYLEFTPAPCPWIVVQGGADEVVPAALVTEFAANAIPPLKLLPFTETGHFFHGKLVDLKSQLTAVIQEQVTI